MASVWHHQDNNNVTVSLDLVNVLEDIDEENLLVIIGAGLTGSSAAYHVGKYENDFTILILDESPSMKLLNGATGRNGGVLWPDESDEFEMRTVKEMKELGFVEMNKENQGGIILVRIGDSDLDSQTFLQEGVKILDDKLQKFIGDDMFAEMYIHPNLPQNIIPIKVVENIATKSKGLFVFGIKVLRIERKESLIHIETNKGIEFNCFKVIVATNGLIPELVPKLKPFINIQTDKVIASKSSIGLEYWPLPVRCWSSGHGDDEVYGSITDDLRIVIGGHKDLNLHQWLLKAFPFLEKCLILQNRENFIEWYGNWCCSSDENPIVGEVEQGIWVCGVYNGHGMPRGFGIAKMLIEAMINKKKIQPEWDVKRFLVSA